MAAPDAYLSFVAVAMVGGSRTGDEVREGTRKVQQRVAMNYRKERDRQAARKPMQEQIRREVAAGAAGKTREQVRSEIAAAYTGLGLEPPPAPLLGAEAVKIIRLTWREKLLAIRDYRAFSEIAWGASPQPDIATSTRVDHPRPAWARPPAGATRGPDGPQVAVRVELTEDGHHVLSRLIDEWQPDAADHQIIGWLTVDPGPADPVTVRLGDIALGRLGVHASDLCREPVADAQAAQHCLRVSALLTGEGSTEHPFLLRLRIPLNRADGQN